MVADIFAQTHPHHKKASYCPDYICTIENTPTQNTGLLYRGKYLLNPANIYLFKVNNGTVKKSEKYLKLTINAPETRHWCRSGVFIVNFEYNSDLFLVFLLLTLSMYLFAGKEAFLKGIYLIT